jgi:hypothetical protein
MVAENVFQYAYLFSDLEIPQREQLLIGWLKQRKNSLDEDKRKMLLDLLPVKPGSPVREPAGHLPLLVQIRRRRKTW